MSRLNKYAATIALPLLLCGCAGTTQTNAPDPYRTQAARFSVQNNLSEVMSLELVSTTGFRWRLGNVGAVGRASFQVPEWAFQESLGVLVVAAPIGLGNRMTFGPVRVQPSSTVEVVLDRSIASAGAWVH